VALRRAKFVFDTQVVSYICDGVIPRAEWNAVRQSISKHARYAISAVTLYELIAGIADGDDRHFSENQARLRVLCEPPKMKILPLARDFIRSSIFRFPPQKPDFGPEKLKIWIHVILAAKTKGEVRGPITLPRSGNWNRQYGFDLSLLASQIKQGKQNHATELEGLRQGKFSIPTPERWTESRLKECGIETSAPNVARLLEGFDAARRYDFFLFALEKNHAYDFARHDSDWLDIMQLCYLADPFVHFITCDADMNLRTAGSPQANRILSFDQLKSRMLAA
jgi:hypothetical protein